MDIWNIEKLTLFLIFFLPGFISMKVYDLMVAGEPRDISKSVFEAIAYSTLNFGVLFWLIAIIQTDDFYHRHLILYSMSVAAIMVVVPACWPFLFLKLSTWRPVAKHFIHPIRKPWDYVFGKRNSFWIIVHLQNGQKSGGASVPNPSPLQTQLMSKSIWKKSGFSTKRGAF
jgi:hypothetical protein